MENPVTLTAQQSNAGWGVIFGMADFKAKELFYKLDGKGDFQSRADICRTRIRRRVCRW